jgi:lipopolysaccharide export system protein LptA
MKRLILISSCSILVLAQTPREEGRFNFGHGNIAIESDRAETTGSKIHFSGNVVIETDTLVVRVGEADFAADTHKIVAHGDSSIDFK